MLCWLQIHTQSATIFWQQWPQSHTLHGHTALCYQPSTGMGMNECEACWHGRDTKGAEAAPVCRGTTVPLSPTDNTFAQWLGTSNDKQRILKNSNQCRHPEVPTSTLLSLDGNPSDFVQFMDKASWFWSQQ